jgi:parallel beta-helix repeat protein
MYEPQLTMLPRSYPDGRKSSYSPRRAAALVAGLLLILAVQGFVLDSEASSAVTCDKYASVSGSDSNTGTAAPYGSAQKLADSLSSGEIGCLRGGTYTEGDTLLKITRPGITLRSAPGERASIKARIHVAEGANGVVVRNLNLDGSPNELPSPTVNADNTRWLNNDVTNRHRSQSCFVIGDKHYGVADGTLISNNRIHDCGRLPRTNYDHGIYINEGRGTRIIDNEIYGNSDRGIQLRTNAQRTVIRRNVIDGNGEGIIFSGSDGTASNNTTVENNIISFSAVRHNVESFYPKGNPTGKGNLIADNCVYGGARGNAHGGIQSPQVGFKARNNAVKNPLYVNRAKDNFRLRAGSPCKAILAG